MVDEFDKKMEVGDEMTLMLASKWLRKNITVITSKRDWSMYDNCPHDIIVTYKGKDRYMEEANGLRVKWQAVHQQLQKKQVSIFTQTFLFIHSGTCMLWLFNICNIMYFFLYISDEVCAIAIFYNSN